MIDSYIAGQTGTGRFMAEQIRAIIHKLVPDCQEAIKYGMPAFQLNEKSFIYFAVWKQHIGIYPIYRGDQEFEKLVRPYRAKKDTVQFGFDQQLRMDIVELIVLTQAQRHRI